MRILIISRTPWDNSNSFGNTFSNLFGGMKEVEIFNVCCQDGVNNNIVVTEAYQMTDRMVLKSITGNDAGHIMSLKSMTNVDLPKPISSNIPPKRYTVFYIVRDIIWKCGKWWDRNLKIFLTEIKPDVIYLPIYASWYMCDVQQKIIDFCKVPVVGHISDDLYNYPPNGFLQPIAYIYRANVRRKVRRLINACSYIEVFAENMAREYARIFDKPFYVIGKGVDTSKIGELKLTATCHNPVRFVYTGNIGSGRYLELAKLSKVLDSAYPQNGAELRVYTKSMMDECMKTAFKGCKSLVLCGGVSSEDVPKIQKDADILVHVESFSKQSVFETKMSFSTKIVDYMMAGKLIFAIGPAEVNSIETLFSHKLALTARSESEIVDNVLAIRDGLVDVSKISENIRSYLKKYRDRQFIQSEMTARLSNLMRR